VKTTDVTARVKGTSGLIPWWW